MVKKKTSDQHETRQKDHNETADNKENSSTQESNSSQNGTDNHEKETTVEEQPAAEKAVPEEKSLEEKLAEMQDKYLRLSAEFDNYRRRSLREKMELSKYASENLLLNILPLMDDFERALSHMETTTDCGAMKDGIDLIYVKFTEFLKQNDVKEIEALNCAFDVDHHHAVAKVQVEEEEKKGKIVEVVQKGYYLQDKVIRHSKVVVGE
ncbi:MAG: nucleotide exchange factor GrpE [Bacteroidetes bacterium RBG_19FT_COMBO_42_10]|nr:MAG: nucleotide exchange factor GrpE [Bacteroidetes bacterium RBG_19FT_COMBO_42_10]